MSFRYIVVYELTWKDATQEDIPFKIPLKSLDFPNPMNKGDEILLGSRSIYTGRISETPRHYVGGPEGGYTLLTVKNQFVDLRAAKEGCNFVIKEAGHLINRSRLDDRLK